MNIVRLIKERFLKFEEIVIIIKLKFVHGENNVLFFLNNNILLVFCLLCGLLGDYFAMKFVKYIYNNVNSSKVLKNIRKKMQEIYLILKKITFKFSNEIKNTINKVKNRFFNNKVFKRVSNLIYYFKKFSQPLQSIKQYFFKLFKESKIREKVDTFIEFCLKILSLRNYFIIMIKEILDLTRELKRIFKNVLKEPTNLSKIIKLFYESISENFIFRLIASIWMYITLEIIFFIVFFVIGVYRREKNMLRLLFWLQLLELHRDYDDNLCTKIFTQKETQPNLFILPENNQINKLYLKLDKSTENFNNQSDKITLPQLFLKNVPLTDDSNTVTFENPIIDVHHFYTSTLSVSKNETDIIEMFKFIFNDNIDLES